MRTRDGLVGDAWEIVRFDENNGGRHGIRTHDPRLRRPVLYPTELTAHLVYIYIILTVYSRPKEGISISFLLLQETGAGYFRTMP